MSWRVSGLMLLLSLGGPMSLSAQTISTIYTNPSPPSSEVLNRLNLKAQWQVELPIDGRTDGIAVVQPAEEMVLVQLRSGVLYAFDIRTGDTLWRFRPPKSYSLVYPVVPTTRTIFIVNGTVLYGLDRKSGARLLEFDVGTTPVAGFTADDETIFVCIATGTMKGYRWPLPSTGEGAKPNPYKGPDLTVQEAPRDSKGGSLDALATSAESGYNRSPSITFVKSVVPPFSRGTGGNSPSIAMLSTLRPPYKMPEGQRTPSVTTMKESLTRLSELSEIRQPTNAPELLWSLSLAQRLDQPPIITTPPIRLQAQRIDQPPLLSSGLVITATTSQTVFGARKDTERTSGEVQFEFPATSSVSANLSASWDGLYVPTLDSNLYALNPVTGNVLWRFTGGGSLNRKPLIAQDLLFAGSEKEGILALNRKTGELLWKDNRPERVLAINPKFVYARDRKGKMIIFDRKRGDYLSSWDINDFNFPVTNELHDRLFLAAHNGLLICLRDKEYDAPVMLRKPPPKIDAKEPPKVEPKKE